MFPLPTFPVHPRRDVLRRHGLFEESLRCALKKAVMHASIAKSVSVHASRHSFATRFLQSDTDIQTVQELLGYSNVSTNILHILVYKVAAGSTTSPLDPLLPIP